MEVDINGKSVRVIVDTAASHSVLRSEDARLAEVMITGETRLRTAGGTVGAREGQVNSLLVAGTHFENHRVLIAEHLPISLLGMDVEGDYNNALAPWNSFEIVNGILAYINVGHTLSNNYTSVIKGLNSCRPDRYHN